MNLKILKSKSYTKSGKLMWLYTTLAISIVHPQKDGQFDDEIRLKNIKQLTFSGENAEAYFSIDGEYLIFQAHEGDILCDQIYIMELSSREIKLVSTGLGVTTCAYFLYPECDNIIYASTHLGGSTCPPRPDYSKGYVWKLYPDNITVLGVLA